MVALTLQSFRAITKATMKTPPLLAMACLCDLVYRLWNNQMRPKLICFPLLPPSWPVCIAIINYHRKLTNSRHLFVSVLGTRSLRWRFLVWPSSGENLSWTADSWLLVISLHSETEKESRGSCNFCKGTSPIHEGLLSWPHLILIISQRLYLLTPSNEKEMEFNTGI